MDDFVVPDFTEEFVGWRGWIVNASGNLAAILHEDAEWMPGEALPAFCGKGRRHPVPFNKCTCGFYATKAFNKFREQGYMFGDSVVWGRCSMWGKSIDYTEGWKTQFAYPREIWVPYTQLHLVEVVAKYGVPVRLANPFTATEASLIGALDGDR
jgi:hypothetical protein